MDCLDAAGRIYCNCDGKYIDEMDEALERLKVLIERMLVDSIGEHLEKVTPDKLTAEI